MSMEGKDYKEIYSYARVTRQMVEDLKESVDKGFKRIDNGIEEIKRENKVLYNHLSNRSLPSDTRIIKILVGALGALFGLTTSLLLTVG